MINARNNSQSQAPLPRNNLTDPSHQSLLADLLKKIE